MLMGKAKQLQFTCINGYVWIMHNAFRPKYWFRWGLIIVLAALCSIWLADFWIRADSDSRTYMNADEIPARKVGLVLGCAPNVYFHYRIDAAVELFKAGKIEFVLVSGDNHVMAYDEAGAMKESLIMKGVPEERIYCDYAGFSTIDSIIRAREIFGQEEITVISQEFHVRRALFIARRKNIDAAGYCARDVEVSIGAPTQLREAFARVKTVLDIYLLYRQPRFLGEPIQIDLDTPQEEPFPRDKA